jgi:hypothetical protein
MRRPLLRHGFGADRAFRWRGGEISRLEGLSDAVFAFAVCFGILTRAEIQGFGINMAVGLASIVIVTVGGADAAFLSGMTYMLIMPLQIVNGRIMGARIRRAAASTTR